MVFYLWIPTRQVKCRALCLEGAHPQLLEVPPYPLGKPGEDLGV